MLLKCHNFHITDKQCPFKITSNRQVQDVVNLGGLNYLSFNCGSGLLETIEQFDQLVVVGGREDFWFVWQCVNLKLHVGKRYCTLPENFRLTGLSPSLAILVKELDYNCMLMQGAAVNVYISPQIEN